MSCTGDGAVAAGEDGVAPGRARTGAVAAACYVRRGPQDDVAALHQHAAGQAEAALRGNRPQLIFNYRVRLEGPMSPLDPNYDGENFSQLDE